MIDACERLGRTAFEARLRAFTSVRSQKFRNNSSASTAFTDERSLSDALAAGRQRR